MSSSKTKILHLSHTDIRYDSRILKEMSVVSGISGAQVRGLGIELDEGAAIGSGANSLNIDSIALITKIFRRFPRSIRYGLNFIELFVRFLIKALLFKPGVVHCHDTLVLPVGAAIKLLTGARLVYDAHELESDKNGQSKYLSKATLCIEKIFWGSVDLFITVSESIERWYLQKLDRKNSIVVLNSPVLPRGPVVTSDYAPNYFRSLYGIENESKIFVYLGFLAEGRGIDLCLNAFAQIEASGAHVVFVGYGPLKDRITSFSMSHSNIHLHPAVPHEDVVALIQSADIGLCFVENVSLSDYYCLPNKLFEYCFAGIPVLASKFPEIEQVVQRYSLGWCADPAIESVKTAILSTLHTSSSPISADVIELSWEAQAEKLHKAYVKLISA